MSTPFRPRTLAPLCLALVASCGGTEPIVATPPTPPAASAVASAAPAAAPKPPPVAAPAAAPVEDMPDVVFGPKTASDAPKKAPRLLVLSPMQDALLATAQARTTDVRVSLTGWETQKGGSHVHLILDNHPYKALFDLKDPVKLGDLLAPGEELTEGEHVLIAFPSRMNHESVKAEGALCVQRFWVGKRGKSAWKSHESPLLVFSRPKGAYNGDKADEVLVDWYLANVELGDKFQIRATLKGPGLDEVGRVISIKEWRPYMLANLRNGDYTISMELLEKSGQVVPSPFPAEFNATTRTIHIDHAASDAPPAAAPSPASSASPAPSPHAGHE